MIGRSQIQFQTLARERRSCRHIHLGTSSIPWILEGTFPCMKQRNNKVYFHVSNDPQQSRVIHTIGYSPFNRPPQQAMQFQSYHTTSATYENKLSHLTNPPTTTETSILQESDFFGEPITFFTNHHESAMEELKAYNELLIGITSKGKSCSGGGDEHGLNVQAAHSYAMAWSKVLHIIHDTTNNLKQQQHEQMITTPMLVIAAICPLLVQTGLSYMKHLDSLIQINTNAKIQLHDLATQTVEYYMTNQIAWKLLSPREQYHLHALNYLLHQNPQGAQQTLQRLLQSCPGDALALSLANDLAYIQGNPSKALRTAGSVSSYWNERTHWHFYTSSQSSSPPTQSTIGNSHVAFGLALGGHSPASEALIEKNQQTERLSLPKHSTGISAWALSYIYDMEGRSSEGVSLLKDYQRFESCGMLFFDSKMAGYGARFTLDRDGSSSDNVALRIYDSYFQRVLEYSHEFPEEYEMDVRRMEDKQKTEDINEGDDHHDNDERKKGLLKAPKQKRSQMLEKVRGSTQSMMQSFFGRTPSTTDSVESKTSSTTSSTSSDSNHHDEEVEEEELVLEDVLTWLPPTPQLLVDATLLLLRLTLSEAIPASDNRWKKLRMSWIIFLETTEQYQDDTSRSNNDLYKDYPMVNALSHLFVPPPSNDNNNDTHNEKETSLSQVSKGLHLLSQLWQLGSDNSTKKEDNPLIQRQDWKQVVHYLASSREAGTNLSTYSPPISLLSPFHSTQTENPVHNVLGPHTSSIQYQPLGHTLETRPLYEHAISYAALQSQDREALNLARSICSESISVRQNCPESWWRYSQILEALGDDVAAQNARNASISLGSGEGGKGAH